MTAPSLDSVEAARRRIAPFIIATPMVPWAGEELAGLLGGAPPPVVKLELFQRTGSFKPRGALNVALQLTPDARDRGFTAVSAGNHAAAVAYAARALGASAKVVMPKSASPFRVGLCRRLGAEVVLADDVDHAFALVAEIRDREGRAFIHPFEGPQTFAGTGTLGLEMLEQARELGGDLDAIVVPCGGGGLLAGLAAAVKQAAPGTRVIGVEPDGARGMSDSLAAGRALEKVTVSTIADSLGPPLHLPLSFALVRDYVDEIVTVSDQAMIDGIGLIARDLKLAVEPAPAAGVAALLGPLRRALAGKRVGLVICGANIDPVTFGRYLAAARPVS